jgi:pimeloyl-ACP methyl ester carboxylesterase
MTWAAGRLKGSYKNLTLPVTIIAGDGDRVVDLQRHAVRLHREIPHSRLLTQAGPGHMLHYGAPDVVVQAVDDTVSDTGRTELPLAGIPVV